MNPQGRTVSQILAAIGEEQHGVAARTDLLDAGLTQWEIRDRVRAGVLLPEFRGVYCVGHRAPSRESDYMAAVRSCGAGAVLSGRAAAHVLGLLRGQPPAPEVAAPTERRVEGVATRRCRRMHARERTIWRGIPVTTAARTLVDLAASLSPEELARACH